MAPLTYTLWGMETIDALNLTQAARYLGISRHLVKVAIRSGRLPALRIGDAYRIRREDCDALFHTEEGAGRA